MTKNIKIIGLCIAIAIVGLSLENALTGHSIKGNKNLNSEVLATGSTGSCTSSWPGDCTITGNNIYYKPIEDIINLTADITFSYEGYICFNYTKIYRINCESSLNGPGCVQSGQVLTSSGHTCGYI